MMTRFKIYGERNCGTNYLYNLLMNNIDSEILGGTVPHYLASYPERIKDAYFSMFPRKSLGWKHGCPVHVKYLKKFCADRGIILTISKSPYAFLSSSYKRPYGMVDSTTNMTILDFLKSNCIVKGRDRIDTHQNINPIELWNIKNTRYLELNGRGLNLINIVYEELIRNPEQQIDDICRIMKIKRKQAFENIEHGTKTDESKSFDAYRDKYLNPKWNDVFDLDSLKFINENLNLETMRKLGYEIVNH